MRTKKFKAESQRLLDMMINSIYTNKDIFLRELISNASDAIDKLYYHALSEGVGGLNRDDFHIDILCDTKNRILTIKDNGCGMTADELEANLGTIAKSGSLEFKATAEKKDEIDIIGQFGVGFYSAFMVADKVEVLSKSYKDGQANLWVSEGSTGYKISEAEKLGRGTEIRLFLKDNDDDADYDDYLEIPTIKRLVKKYSDYVRYPITVEVPVEKADEEGKMHPTGETETQTINSMVPLWKKSKSEVSEEDYKEFYKSKFNDTNDPLRTIVTSAEGKVTYNALLYIPSKPPFNYSNPNFEKGLALYAKGVMIMENCTELLPDYFGFVRGLVDSEDLSLNISREMLQQNNQLRLIASHVQRKIKGELTTMMNNDRATYQKFFNDFGDRLKYGVYADFGVNKEVLKDLLMFYSDSKNELISFKEYVADMAEDQKVIYYNCGPSLEKIKNAPQMEAVRDHGYDILCCDLPIDEFVLKVMGSYDDKKFVSVAGEDLNFADENKETPEESEANKNMIAFMKDVLGEKVTDIRISNRLKSHAVCLTAEGEVSIEMERVLNAMPGNNKTIRSKRVLEINGSHPIFDKLTFLYDNDQDTLIKYTKVLLDQALLIEGLPPEDPVEYAANICELLS